MTRSNGHPRRSRAAALRRAIALSLMALGAAVAAAAPYRPREDTQVLERVPQRTALERLAPLRTEVAARPAELAPALDLATAYIELGRRNSDPRFIAYAQATLLPWLARPQPPERVLVLQAITLQYLHHFAEALAVLDRALALVPLDGQAWLTRASLLELRADYPGARRACARLLRSADEFTALTCLESVDGRSGRLDAAYSALRDRADLDPRLPPGLRAWRLAVSAEMAERLGDDRAAEADLRTALSVAGDDPYVRASYADLLLRLGRPGEVITLLAGSEAEDPLLLRLAIAGRRADSPQARYWAQAYAARVSAAARDGDTTHLREQAMFLLDVCEDAPAALAVAARNFAVQREPADVRLYARAAARAHAARDAAAIIRWLEVSHYEDRTLLTAAPESRGP